MFCFVFLETVDYVAEIQADSISVILQKSTVSLEQWYMILLVLFQLIILSQSDCWQRHCDQIYASLSVM